MSVGLMMLPAIAARHWSDSLAGQVRVAVLLACLSSVGGLVLSYNLDIPAGPAIVLTAGRAVVAQPGDRPAGEPVAAGHAKCVGGHSLPRPVWSAQVYQRLITFECCHFVASQAPPR